MISGAADHGEFFELVGADFGILEVE